MFLIVLSPPSSALVKQLDCFFLFSFFKNPGIFFWLEKNNQGLRRTFEENMSLSSQAAIRGFLLSQLISPEGIASDDLGLD